MTHHFQPGGLVPGPQPIPTEPVVFPKPQPCDTITGDMRMGDGTVWIVARMKQPGLDATFTLDPDQAIRFANRLLERAHAAKIGIELAKHTPQNGHRR